MRRCTLVNEKGRANNRWRPRLVAQAEKWILSTYMKDEANVQFCWISLLAVRATSVNFGIGICVLGLESD